VPVMQTTCSGARARAPSNELHLDSARSILFRLVTRSIDRSIDRSFARGQHSINGSRARGGIIRRSRSGRSATLVRDVRDDEISRYRRASIARLLNGDFLSAEFLPRARLERRESPALSTTNHSRPSSITFLNADKGYYIAER